MCETAAILHIIMVHVDYNDTEYDWITTIK